MLSYQFCGPLRQSEHCQTNLSLRSHLAFISYIYLFILLKFVSNSSPLESKGVMSGSGWNWVRFRFCHSSIYILTNLVFRQFILLIQFILVIYGRCVYIMMLDNFCLWILQSYYFYNFCNLNYRIDSYQWWMYLRDQLQIVNVFGFLLGFAWKLHFNLSLDWFCDMFIHFSLSFDILNCVSIIFL